MFNTNFKFVTVWLNVDKVNILKIQSLEILIRSFLEKVFRPKDENPTMFEPMSVLREHPGDILLWLFLG